MSAAPWLAPPAVPTWGEVEARAPLSGVAVNLDRDRLYPLHSYNPRRYADSRRRWARTTAAKFSQVPANATITTTLEGRWHGGPPSRELLDHETQAARLFKQLVDRWLRSIASKHGRCVECVREARACPGSAHAGARWHLIGSCGQCGRWQRLEWFASRWAWVCSRCLARPRLKLQKRDRKTGSIFAMVRELEDDDGNLGNPHRHIKAVMPYVPQDLLSEFAQRAGLGAVVWVEKNREGGLDSYLSKQGQCYVPAHPMLSAYFTKQAERPDAFNAFPKGAARVRLNYPVELPARPGLPLGTFVVMGETMESARRRFLPWTLPTDDPDYGPRWLLDYSRHHGAQCWCVGPCPAIGPPAARAAPQQLIFSL